MNEPPEDSVASPCVRNCCLDQNDVCMGCGRTLDEIRCWNALSVEERRQVINRSRERHLQRLNNRHW